MTENKFFEVCKETFQEMRNNGITSVGEFHYFHHKEERHGKVRLFALYSNS
jgi:hypothetical protein